MKLKNKIIFTALSSLSLLVISPSVLASNSTEKTIIEKVNVVIEQNPNNFTQNLMEDLENTLKSKQKEINSNPNVLKSIIQEKIMIYTNFKYAGSLILGKNFKKFSEEDRERFFKSFEKYLVSSYAQIFTLYNGQKMKLIPISFNSSDNIVKTKIELDNNAPQPVKIQFALRKNSKTNIWQLYDIVAEGVSLVESKKTEWASKFKDKDSLDQLIKELEDFSKKDIIKNK